MQSDNYLLGRFYIVDIKSRDGNIICLIEDPSQVARDFPTPLRGLAGDELLFETHLMFGWGGDGFWLSWLLTCVRYIYKNALDIYSSFFRVIFSSCSHSKLFHFPLSSLPSIVLATTKPPSSQHSDINRCYVFLFHVGILFDILPFLSSHCFMFEINMFIGGICGGLCGFGWGLDVPGGGMKRFGGWICWFLDLQLGILSLMIFLVDLSGW